MVRENWCFWIILLGFVGQILSTIRYAGGYKRKVTWDGDLTDRMLGIVLSVMFAVIYAIALGWL